MEIKFLNVVSFPAIAVLKPARAGKRKISLP